MMSSKPRVNVVATKATTPTPATKLPLTIYVRGRPSIGGTMARGTAIIWVRPFGSQYLDTAGFRNVEFPQYFAGHPQKGVSRQRTVKDEGSKAVRQSEKKEESYKENKKEYR